jgi:hypothetical protein
MPENTDMVIQKGGAFVNEGTLARRGNFSNAFFLFR